MHSEMWSLSLPIRVFSAGHCSGLAIAIPMLVPVHVDHRFLVSNRPLTLHGFFVGRMQRIHSSSTGLAIESLRCPDQGCRFDYTQVLREHRHSMIPVAKAAVEQYLGIAVVVLTKGDIRQNAHLRLAKQAAIR